MDNRPDNELLDAAIHGDPQAFEALAKRYYGTVYRYAYRWVSATADAEDVTQEVFIKVARRLDTFDRRAAFSSWLYRVTANCAKDFLRKNRSRKDRGELVLLDRSFADASPDPETQIQHRQVLSAVNDLPSKYREAILLVFGEGLSHQQAAEVLGCAETTVSWRIHQAKKKLQKVLP